MAHLEQYRTLTIADLKKLAKKHGLAAYGNKGDYTSRIAAAAGEHVLMAALKQKLEEEKAKRDAAARVRAGKGDERDPGNILGKRKQTDPKHGEVCGTKHVKHVHSQNSDTTKSASAKKKMKSTAKPMHVIEITMPESNTPGTAKPIDSTMPTSAKPKAKDVQRQEAKTAKGEKKEANDESVVRFDNTTELNDEVKESANKEAKFVQKRATDRIFMKCPRELIQTWAKHIGPEEDKDMIKQMNNKELATYMRHYLFQTKAVLRLTNDMKKEERNEIIYDYVTDSVENTCKLLPCDFKHRILLALNIKCVKQLTHATNEAKMTIVVRCNNMNKLIAEQVTYETDYDDDDDDE